MNRLPIILYMYWLMLTQISFDNIVTSVKRSKWLKLKIYFGEFHGIEVVQAPYLRCYLLELKGAFLNNYNAVSYFRSMLRSNYIRDLWPKRRNSSHCIVKYANACIQTLISQVMLVVDLSKCDVKEGPNSWR